MIIQPAERFKRLDTVFINKIEYSFAYEVYISNYGNIYKKINNKKIYATPVFDNSKGYYVVNLHLLHNNKQYHKNLLVHRLVAILFVDNINEYNIVNHIDGNKQNNFYKNLEWCTNKMNMIHASHNGLCKPAYGENHYRSKLNDELVRIIVNMYRLGYKTKFIYNYISNLYKINVSESTLKQIKNKRSWKHIVL